MPFSYKDLLFGSTTFCCCLPVRLGVISMSILGCLVAGLLTVILWFEVHSAQALTGQERIAFVIAAITETALFAASIFGLVGAIAQKQLFIQVYAYILYVHFIINIVVAGFLTFEISHGTGEANAELCHTAITNSTTQNLCSGFLNFATWVYVVIALVVLSLEFYGAIIVTRYLNQLKREKGAVRSLRLDTENAFQLHPRNGYTRLDALENPATSGSVDDRTLDTEFNPYSESDLTCTHNGHVHAVI